MPRMPATHAQRMKAMQPRPPEDRPTASGRGYGATWRDLRRMKLNRNPMCEQVGCAEVATDVDHILARARGGDDRMANLQALCHAHHSQKTVREDGGFGRQSNRKPSP